MTGAEIVQEKFATVLRWEKSKRRKDDLAAAGFYAIVAALATLPLPLTWMHRMLVPTVAFASCALLQIIRQRWTARDDARAVARLDKTLGMEERALTAWELLPAQKTTGPAALVIAQTAERLKTFDARAIFPRKSRWQERSILPLIGLWFVLLWLGAASRHVEPQPAPRGLAYEAREFSRDLQEKAKRE